VAAVIRKTKTAPKPTARKSREASHELPAAGWPVIDASTGQVTVPRYEYLGLLIEANETDPALWPKGLKKGAKLLARIRRIEADCIRCYGEFDWEKLDRATQDIYDGSRGELNKLIQDPNEPLTSWEDFRREREARPKSK
jgi:hypothetical protein